MITAAQFALLMIIASLSLFVFAVISLHSWRKCKKRLQQIIDEMEVDA